MKQVSPARMRDDALCTLTSPLISPRQRRSLENRLTVPLLSSFSFLCVCSFIFPIHPPFFFFSSIFLKFFNLTYWETRCMCINIETSCICLLLPLGCVVQIINRRALGEREGETCCTFARSFQTFHCSTEQREKETCCNII